LLFSLFRLWTGRHGAASAGAGIKGRFGCQILAGRGIGNL